MATVTLSPKLTAGSVTADQIPAEVKADVEAIWKSIQANPDQDIRVEETTKEAVLKWLRYAVSYGSQRMDEQGQSAKLLIRALPKRNLPDNVKYISIKRDLPGDGPANSNQTSR